MSNTVNKILSHLDENEVKHIRNRGLSSLSPSEKLDLMMKVPSELLDDLCNEFPRFKFIAAMQKLRKMIEDEVSLHRLFKSTGLITEREYAFLESRIPFTFARELINDFGIKNSIILKIARPHAFIMK